MFTTLLPGILINYCYSVVYYKEYPGEQTPGAASGCSWRLVKGMSITILAIVMVDRQSLRIWKDTSRMIRIFADYELLADNDWLQRCLKSF